MVAPSATLAWADAALLAVGVSVFLGGHLLYRGELQIRQSRAQAIAAAVALATVPVGALVSALTQLSALVAVLAATLVIRA